jgi:ABC-2 type transport system permease protein
MTKPFLLLTKIEVLRMLRNRYFVIYAIILPIVYYLIFSLSNEPEFYAYLLIAMLVFSLLSGAVTTFAIGLAYDNSRPWRTSMKALPVSELVVSGAKLTSQLLLNSVTVVTLIAFVQTIHGLPGSVGQWCMIAVWFIGVSAVFMTLGVAISSLGKQGTVSGIANFTWIFLMFAAGTWIPIEQFPGWVQPFASWSPGAIAIAGAFRLLDGGYPLIGQIGGLILYTLLFMGIFRVGGYINRRVAN